MSQKSVPVVTPKQIRQKKAQKSTAPKVNRRSVGFLGSLPLPLKLALLSSALLPSYLLAVFGINSLFSAQIKVAQKTIEGAQVITDLSSIEESIYSGLSSSSVNRATLDRLFVDLREKMRDNGENELATKVEEARTAFAALPITLRREDAAPVLINFYDRYITPINAGIYKSYPSFYTEEVLESRMVETNSIKIPQEIYNINQFTKRVIGAGEGLAGIDREDALLYEAGQKRFIQQLRSDVATPARNLIEAAPVAAVDIAKFNQAISEFESGSQRYMDAIYSGQPAEISVSYIAQMEALSRLQKLMGAEIKKVAQARTAVTRSRKDQSFYYPIIVLLLTGVLVYLVLRSITRPLKALELGARKVEEGQFHIRVPITSNDEIGEVSRAFNAATAKLQENEIKNELERIENKQIQSNIAEFLDVAMDIAEGDFRRRGKVTEDTLGNVVDAINLMTDELGQVIKQVNKTTESVIQNSQAVLADSGQISSGVQLTAEETIRVSNQIQELIYAIRQMAEDAQASAKTARLALMASKQGQEAVQETLAGMQEIRQEVQGVAKRIQLLGDRSQEIEEIVDTISQITRQTNLLALNASVEAAGAGKAGGRFTIVASEVRKLANTSAQATTRIANLIRTVQIEIQDVIGNMNESTKQVEEGYRIAGTTGERINEISTLVEESAKFAERIASSTNQQALTVEQVGSVVKQIANIAQVSKDSAERSQNTAENLERLARELGSSLTKFKLPN